MVGELAADLLEDGEVPAVDGDPASVQGFALALVSAGSESPRARGRRSDPRPDARRGARGRVGTHLRSGGASSEPNAPAGAGTWSWAWEAFRVGPPGSGRRKTWEDRLRPGCELSGWRERGDPPGSRMQREPSPPPSHGFLIRYSRCSMQQLDGAVQGGFHSSPLSSPGFPPGFPRVVRVRIRTGALRRPGKQDGKLAASQREAFGRARAG